MNKRWLVALCAVMTLVLVAGCQSTASSTASASASDATTIYGQVTAIDGNSITLALGTVSQQGHSDNAPEMPSDGTQPSGEIPAMPSGGQGTDDISGTTQNTDGSASQSDGQGGPDAISSATQNTDDSTSKPSEQTRPEQSDGNGGQRQPGGIELTGEETTITVTDSTVITLQSFNESSEGSLDDIKVRGILSVTMSGDTVTAITVMQTGGGMPNGSVPSGSLPSDSEPAPTT